jgi:hypothetical protein
MTPQEIAQIITLARRAPLANMAEAERAAQLLQKLAQHFAPKVGDVPETNDADAESAKPPQSSEQ